MPCDGNTGALKMQAYTLVNADAAGPTPQSEYLSWTEELLPPQKSYSLLSHSDGPRTNARKLFTNSEGKRSSASPRRLAELRGSPLFSPGLVQMLLAVG